MHDGDTPRRAAGNVLYLVISGAAAPGDVPALAAACQAAGWRVSVFSTPNGTRFIDPAELEQLTGEAVRSEYRLPGTGAPVPPGDAVLACPLTFNSVNKFAHGHADNFAHGHADNFAVGLLCEMPATASRSWSCRYASPSSPATRRSPRACRRCAAWACGCCSTPMRRRSTGSRRGMRSSQRFPSRPAPGDAALG
jgi:hypothetical protein